MCSLAPEPLQYPKRIVRKRDADPLLPFLTLMPLFSPQMCGGGVGFGERDGKIGVQLDGLPCVQVSQLEVIENQIRPIALTRKNALFAGNDIGAEN